MESVNPDPNIPVAEKAASILSDTITTAPDDETRAQIVDAANSELDSAHVRVIDLAAHGSQRLGKSTGLTREELLDRIDVTRKVQAIRASRMLGRLAL